MKFLLVLVAVIAGACAGQQGGGYGPPGVPEQQPQGPQVHRHVYVHVAPDEPVDAQSKIIRVPGGGDKHVNIIFVKTPSQSSSQQTEVILPEQDQHKNLVYVLLKKGESNSNIKVSRPPAARPSKPEVYFIRYKGQEQEQGPAYGAPAPVQAQAPAPVRQVSNQYGTPY